MMCSEIGPARGVGLNCDDGVGNWFFFAAGNGEDGNEGKKGKEKRRGGKLLGV